MGKAKLMTHEDHLKLAYYFRQHSARTNRLYYDVQYLNGKTKRCTKLMGRIVDLTNELKSELDRMYHSVTTDEQFAQHGHVYYGKADIQDDPNAKSFLKEFAAKMKEMNVNEPV